MFSLVGAAPEWLVLSKAFPSAGGVTGRAPAAAAEDAHPETHL